jgi:hypothetical protein
MKFAKIIFWIAAVWGILVITPLYFLFDTIGRQDPPPITHPGFYYGFAGCGLAWQLAFIVIAINPLRFRTMMLPSVFEKFGFGAATGVLYLQHRLHASDLALGAIDTVLGVLFLVAFFRTPAKMPSQA